MQTKFHFALSRPTLTLTAAFVALLLTCVSLVAQTVTPIYSFSSDLYGPGGPLVFDSAGNAFGAMISGGTHGFGGIFELSPPAVAGDSWTLSIIYNFDYGEHATAEPFGLAIDASGNLYGATAFSAVSNCPPEGACGNVFKLSPPPRAGDPWGYHLMHKFAGSPADGEIPGSGVVLMGGKVYGTTLEGGPNDGGVVYQITQSGGGFTENIIYSFPAYTGDGFFPVGLTHDAEGNLYGVTFYTFEALSNGIVYKLTPPSSGSGPWTETVLFSFDDTYGSQPAFPPAFDSSGGLWITTQSGGAGIGGTLFRLQRPQPPDGQWQPTLVFSFSNQQGQSNIGGLIYDRASNTIYGANPGLYDGCGYLYQATESSGTWTYATLYNLSWSEGCEPEVPLSLNSSGQIFGLATEGGANPDGGGTAFQFTP